jgi:hypothetical protein
VGKGTLPVGKERRRMAAALARKPCRSPGAWAGPWGVGVAFPRLSSSDEGRQPSVLTETESKMLEAKLCLLLAPRSRRLL